MKKVLRFEIKQNLRRASRVYVKSHDLKINYGYFHADNPASFDGWDKLSKDETMELQLFIQNIDAVNAILGSDASNKLMDFRFRLPIDFVEAIHQLSFLFNEEDIKINLFEAALTGMIQQLKIAATQLKAEKKQDALTILDKVGLAEYKKMDLASPIQAVFSELLGIHNRSEKLHGKALNLFEKDKSYSPKAIEGMAKGETIPSKWLVACAIDILIDEKQSVLAATLSENDVFMLWAKQLFDNMYSLDELMKKVKKIKMPEVERKILAYTQQQQKAGTTHDQE